MYLQVPRRFRDSYKCGDLPRKLGTRKFVYIQLFFYLRISTRLFNFNCENVFFNCVFTQICCLSVSLMLRITEVVLQHSTSFSTLFITAKIIFLFSLSKFCHFLSNSQLKHLVCSYLKKTTNQ